MPTRSVISLLLKILPNLTKKQSKRFTFQDSKQAKRCPASSKTQGALTKTNPAKLAQLLQEYKEKSSEYRDDDFSQQASSFIAKIASDEKIPSDLKGRFSLYYILVSIAKIFMMNEYELALLACAIDKLEWNMDSLVREDEGSYLSEFPCSLEVEITSDCRQLIIYLLIVAFTLKNNITQKAEMELIQAYCEKICKNFVDLLKRSSKVKAAQNLNFSAFEVNEKFRHLSRKDHREPFMKSVKDYNMVVESILRLTGSHTIKPKAKTNNCQKLVKIEEKSTKNFDDSHTGDSLTDTDMFYADFNKDFEAINVPFINVDFSRQASAFIGQDEINTKREAEYDLFEEETNSKKIKGGEDFFLFSQLNSQSLVKKDSTSGFFEGMKRSEDDIFDVVELDRKTSNIFHQIQEEIPMFTRFDSTFSLCGK